MIINAKKAISGGSKILTYFFTRNVPYNYALPVQHPGANLLDDARNLQSLLVHDPREHGVGVVQVSLKQQKIAVPRGLMLDFFICLCGQKIFT